jgi:hypothetical protein
VGCDRLQPRFHGKEGVDGSSPSEGSAKAPHIGAFSIEGACTVSSVQWVWIRFMELSDPEGPVRPASSSLMRLVFDAWRMVVPKKLASLSDDELQQRAQ